MPDINDMVAKGFPKEVVEECMKDEKCKKKLMDKYTESLAVEREGKELERIAEECTKDKDCNEKAKQKYLGYLDARKSKQVLDAVDKGVNIGYTIAKAIFVILILYALFQFIWWMVTGFPPFIQELMDQLTSALENAFQFPDFPTTTTMP